MSTISRREFVAAMPLVGVDYWLPDPGTLGGFGLSPGSNAERVWLFNNVRILLGASGQVSEPGAARVENGAVTAIQVVCAGGAGVVEGGGRTLIPGLMEAHWQACRCRQSTGTSVALSHWTYLTLRAGGREIAGLGVVIAPRIWPINALAGELSSDGCARERLLHSFSLRITEGSLSICDPAGIAQTASSEEWSSCASVHALTAKPIKVEIARAVTKHREKIALA